MSRPSSVVRAELDALNAERVKIDQMIESLRKELHALNEQVPALEREFQAAFALEQQAAVAAKS